MASEGISAQDLPSMFNIFFPMDVFLDFDSHLCIMLKIEANASASLLRKLPKLSEFGSELPADGCGKGGECVGG
jgi:hypothetical protein